MRGTTVSRGVPSRRLGGQDLLFTLVSNEVRFSYQEVKPSPVPLKTLRDLGKGFFFVHRVNFATYSKVLQVSVENFEQVLNLHIPGDQPLEPKKGKVVSSW